MFLSNNNYLSISIIKIETCISNNTPLYAEKKKYQRLRALAFTNDTAETRWKKTLRDPNGKVLDPLEANEITQKLALRKRNETLFESVARVAQHVNVKRHETLNPEITLLHKQHSDIAMISPPNNKNKLSNEITIESYIKAKNQLQQNNKKKKRHPKFKKLRPWAKKCIESFDIDFIDPQFVSDYRRFICLEKLLEEKRYMFSHGTEIFANPTTVTIDDVKSLMWKGNDYESLVNKKKIQLPILRVYTGVDIIADKVLFIEKIKKEMWKDEI